MHKLFDPIAQARLIAILRGIPNDLLPDTVRALYAGGIRFVEVAFDQRNPPCAPLAIQLISRLGLVTVGAGTVMSPAQVREAVRGGAEYIITPNTDPAVIQEAKELGLFIMPGAFTPTEVAAAWKAGADLVKVFPAGQLGPGYIRDLRGPYSHIPLAAVGGINAGNAPDFLRAGCTAVCASSCLCSMTDIRAGRFDLIEAAARQMTDAVARA